MISYYVTIVLYARFARRVSAHSLNQMVLDQVQYGRLHDIRATPVTRQELIPSRLLLASWVAGAG